MQYAKCLCLNLPKKFSQRDMPHIRAMMAYELITQQILGPRTLPNDNGLKVIQTDDKGRGITTTTFIKKGVFVAEY